MAVVEALAQAQEDNMKRFLLLLLIVCLATSLFSCAVQNENNGTVNTATDSSTGASLDTSTSIGTDTSTSIGTDTSASVSTDINTSISTDTGTVNSSNNAKNGTQGEENMQEFVLKGIVIAINDKLEIEVIESDYAFGIYHVIVPNNIPITSASGSAITLDDIKPSNTVLVKYSGQTMLSYPPQIVAYSINLQ